MGVISLRVLRTALVVVCVLFGQVGSPSTVRAEAESAGEVEVARKLFYRALALQDRGKWSQALELLEKVASIRESAQVRFNIAFNQEHLGRITEAVVGYERSLVLAERANAPHVARAAQARLEKLATRVARLVIVLSPEEGAVELDGAPVAVEDRGRPIVVAVGQHAIEAEAQGYRKLRTVVAVSRGETREVTLELEPLAEPSSASPSTEPPLRSPDAAARPSREPPPERRPRPLPPPKAPASRAPAAPGVLPYVAGAGALVALATAGVFYALRQDALDTLQTRCDGRRCPEDLRSADERGEVYTTAGNVALAAGLGLAGVSVGLFVLGVGETSPGEPARIGFAATLGGEL